MNIEMSDLIILNDFFPSTKDALVGKEVMKLKDKFDICFIYPEKELHIGMLHKQAKLAAKYTNKGKNTLILTRSYDLLLALNTYIIAHGCSEKVLVSAGITRDHVIDPKKCKAYTLQPNIQNMDCIYAKREEVTEEGVHWELIGAHISKLNNLIEALIWGDE